VKANNQNAPEKLHNIVTWRLKSINERKLRLLRTKAGNQSERNPVTASENRLCRPSGPPNKTAPKTGSQQAAVHCRRCLKLGHKEADCQNAPKAYKNERVMCLYCGNFYLGVWRYKPKSCLVTNANAHYKALYMPVSINGGKFVSGLRDTGSDLVIVD